VREKARERKRVKEGSDHQRRGNGLVIDNVDFGLFLAQGEENLAGVIREHMTIVDHQIILPCVYVCARGGDWGGMGCKNSVITV
jgi:hypothetical protein